MAMGFQYPPSSNSRGGASNTAAAFVWAILSFNLAAFIAGFVLTTRKNHVQGGLHPLRMNYPTPAQWRWRHQLLLTVCIACLIVSHSIVSFLSDGNKNFISTIDVNTTSSVFYAWLLVLLSAGFLNSLLSGGSLIVLRSGNMSGTVMDMFLGVAFALRSRNTSRMWRVMLQFCTFFAFYLGGIAGSLVFASTFASSSLLFPAIVLAPMWFFGCSLLFLRYRNPEYLSDAGRETIYEDVARGAAAQLDARPSHFAFRSHISSAIDTRSTFRATQGQFPMQKKSENMLDE